MIVTAANLQKKDYLRFKDEIWQVTDTSFFNPGKGRTVMRTKLKSVKTDKTVSKTFTSSEKVEIVEVNSVLCQFLYQDKRNAHFIDQQSYEQHELPVIMFKEAINYLKEGQELYIILDEEQVIGLRLPKKVELKVTETEIAIKGNTATNAKKPATLETGVVVQVPLFINKGDSISVNPETGEYRERIK